MFASFPQVAGYLALVLGLLPNLVLVQCGPDNDGARCLLNVCCSSAGYCETTSVYCSDGCQSAYGSCSVPTVPSCSSDGKTATNGHRVGYWRIQTNGLTHLILAFADFDSSSFAVGAQNPQDVEYYMQFTALQSSSLQTWIAIGGGSFSTETWSSMAALLDSRSAFISSLKSFMETYSFQGVTLDWEFPATADAANLVSLVQELQAAFGKDIQGFNAAGMGKYVDFFNFMAYDLHGWRIDQEPAKNTVTYQANIVDIANDLMPL
ncbi:glycoside hydrolase [Fusarium agapanthi]|uniref:chitinase n=1 Tax=Fusarium agapanthi TaxID=1803897 RepID=A0A9P5BAR9_9HYPO|nr:glycoside hydrolase [Fusarium agapanthi]